LLYQIMLVVYREPRNCLAKQDRNAQKARLLRGPSLSISSKQLIIHLLLLLSYLLFSGTGLAHENIGAFTAGYLKVPVDRKAVTLLDIASQEYIYYVALQGTRGGFTDKEGGHGCCPKRGQTANMNLAKILDVDL
jgi:hypothetical protein